MQDRKGKSWFVNRIGKAAAYEQLAEECAELSHAALKAARILRTKNPTPITLPQAEGRIVEEYSDVRLLADELRLYPDDRITKDKARRWKARLKAAGKRRNA